MDSKSQELMQAITHMTHQKNRTDSMDYLEMWSPKPERRWIFRWNFGRRAKATHQAENARFSPRPAWNKMR